MNNRQAAGLLACIFLLGSYGCAAPAATLPSPTLPAETSTLAPTPTATLTPAPTPTATPLACLRQPGRVEAGVLDTTKPPQQYRIYLPPCYDQQTDLRYPVLYLLHGQTYTDDQWLRMGADRIADRLIHSGEASPFMIVFPDDRYWNLSSGPGFGDRLIGSLIPYIDATYRTMDDREHRALGGLSRGGGWAVRLGLTHPELFGTLGFHSPAVFKDDNPHVASWVKAIPTASFPRLWLDVGDRDGELGAVRLLEGILTQQAVVHEFHLYSGDHSESYWSQHIEEYLQWYVSTWAQE